MKKYMNINKKKILGYSMILGSLIGFSSVVLASKKQAPERLPEKMIACEELGFKSTLNSHWIYYESQIKGVDSFYVAVDESTLGDEEIYLNYVSKDCSQENTSPSQSCKFNFKVYRVLPDQKISEVYEDLTFDFTENKVRRSNFVNGNVSRSEIQLPVSCASLASAYIERENQLNERSKNLDENKK